MKSADPSMPPPKTLGANNLPILSLRKALESMRGNANFSLLGDIHRIACEKFGLEASLDESLEVLIADPDFFVEIAPMRSASRVSLAQS